MDPEITGQETRDVHYAGKVDLLFKGAGVRTLSFAFTYVPGADAGKRIRDKVEISVAWFERLAYVADDGRMTLPRGARVDLGPFAVRIERAISLELVDDPTRPQPVYLELTVIHVADARIAEWRDQPIVKGATISGEFLLRPRGERPRP